MTHTDDRAKFLSLIEAELNARIGPDSDTERELDIVGKAAGPYTLAIGVRTLGPDDAAVYAIDVTVDLPVIPGLDPDPLPEAELDKETGMPDPDFEPYVTRAERVTQTVEAILTAVGLADWEPVRDEKSVKAAEKAAADAQAARDAELEEAEA